MKKFGLQVDIKPIQDNSIILIKIHWITINNSTYLGVNIRSFNSHNYTEISMVCRLGKSGLERLISFFKDTHLMCA